MTVAYQGTYYLGRVIKLGELNQESFLSAITEPEIIHYRGNAWTFTDIQEFEYSGQYYVFGRLTKFTPEGEVTVVDTSSHSEKKQIEQNLRIASSPFIYIPDYSGICYLNVTNQIEQKGFINRFCDIIKAKFNGFFVDCDIELISDLKSFAAKLSSLERIFYLSSTISPPNPLFNPLWKDLEEYLRGRNTNKMSVLEDSDEKGAINTKLPEIIERASEQTEGEAFTPEAKLPIGDAAILMAADGYGKGKVRGKTADETVTIRTAETAMNFVFDSDPDPEEFYLKIVVMFENIEKSRHMEHGE